MTAATKVFAIFLRKHVGMPSALGALYDFRACKVLMTSSIASRHSEGIAGEGVVHERNVFDVTKVS
jgi:hypothetical protein